MNNHTIVRRDGSDHGHLPVSRYVSRYKVYGVYTAPDSVIRYTGCMLLSISDRRL